MVTYVTYSLFGMHIYIFVIYINNFRNCTNMRIYTKYYAYEALSNNQKFVTFGSLICSFISMATEVFLVGIYICFWLWHSAHALHIHAYSQHVNRVYRFSCTMPPATTMTTTTLKYGDISSADLKIHCSSYIIVSMERIKFESSIFGTIRTKKHTKYILTIKKSTRCDPDIVVYVVVHWTWLQWAVDPSLLDSVPMECITGGRV